MVKQQGALQQESNLPKKINERQKLLAELSNTHSGDGDDINELTQRIKRITKSK